MYAKTRNRQQDSWTMTPTDKHVHMHTRTDRWTGRKHNGLAATEWVA